MNLNHFNVSESVLRWPLWFGWAFQACCFLVPGGTCGPHFLLHSLPYQVSAWQIECLVAGSATRWAAHSSADLGKDMPRFRSVLLVQKEQPESREAFGENNSGSWVSLWKLWRHSAKNSNMGGPMSFCHQNNTALFQNSPYWVKCVTNTWGI